MFRYLFFSSQLLSGGSLLDVSITGAADVLPTITDLQDGTYRVSFLPDVIGIYTISVISQGVPLGKGGISLLSVLSAPIQPGRSTAAGTGIKSCTAGDLSTFLVHTKDLYDNPGQAAPHLSWPGPFSSITCSPKPL